MTSLKELQALRDAATAATKVAQSDAELVLAFADAVAMLEAAAERERRLIGWADAMAACPELRECCTITVKEYTKFRQSLAILGGEHNAK